jgi:hypothetical protein
VSVRGVPAQELPENQAPEVAYNLIEQTGEKIPLELGEQVDPGEPPAEPIKRRGRKPKAGGGTRRRGGRRRGEWRRWR